MKRTTMTQKRCILFLCTGNSCRSQMAEGWTRHLKNDDIDVWSAGIETHGLNPFAVQVMGEKGVDISTHKSKLLSDLDGMTFDAVITVCDHANESCPFFPGQTRRIHHSFEDPPRLAAGKEGEERLDCYRKVRDEIRDFVDRLPGILNPENKGE